MSMSGFKWTGPTRPKYPLSAKRVVPDHIVRPDYADHRKQRAFAVKARPQPIKLTAIQLEANV